MGNCETLLLHYLVTFVGDDKLYSVPLKEGNRHYKQILAWVAEGNTIADAD